MYSSITISSSNFSNTWISLLKNLTSSLSSKQYSRRSLSKRSFLLILSFVIRFAILYFSFSWLLGYQQFFLVAVPNHIILIADSAVNRILCSKQNGIKKLM
ncbi:TPA: hypothetical protein MIN49_24990 [Klebsiella pneumoniae]|nr:hypothetical protein [Klebsiella pneumoniae]RLZ85899.1 hypothetical protein EA160_22195 [Klebsiella pneumoniae]HBY0134720.1 hypothetical protein [Klebsiella pneumoniae]HBY2508135.1 hypothetical protein [Klebsiella pneumoniae]